MDHSYPYIASLTREPFLFYEMRSTAKLMVEGNSDDAIVKEIVEQNLFQYPTEKSITRMAKACIKRLHALEDDSLVSAIASQPTDEYMIKELLFEGSNRYYDQALCTGLNVTDEHIDALCKAMKEQAVRNARTEEQKASIKDVGRQQLRSWGILIERDGKDYPSNAFAILTGNGGLHVATQCGVFKGTTKGAIWRCT